MATDRELNIADRPMGFGRSQVFDIAVWNKGWENGDEIRVNLSSIAMIL
jgi:hypothetical protein